jgi:hypothetical protein
MSFQFNSVKFGKHSRFQGYQIQLNMRKKSFCWVLVRLSMFSTVVFDIVADKRWGRLITLGAS